MKILIINVVSSTRSGFMLNKCMLVSGHLLKNQNIYLLTYPYLKESLVQTERQKESLQEELATMQALLIEATEALDRLLNH